VVKSGEVRKFPSRSFREREHKIFWTSRNAARTCRPPSFLRGFFVHYARRNLRPLPWRDKSVSPFHLLLAEVLLVQTKADDVARIWPKMILRYPAPDALHKSRVSTLVRLLQPLGLQNQRARSLKTISATLLQRFQGAVPGRVDHLLSIRHIGLYTAAAVACFKFAQRVPIVDANTLRVLGRITGHKSGKDLRRSKEIWSLAWALLPRKNCALHNYGLLDFAGQVCTVNQPQCLSCTLNKKCAYGQQRLVGGSVGA
jgi:A/G-specific adenine glycosylase